MKKFAVIFGIWATIFFSSSVAIAQDENALRLLNSALDALGGKEKIGSFKSIYFSASGTENGTAVGQSYDPGRDTFTKHEEKLAVFSDGVRLAYEYKTERGDGTTRWRRFMFADGRRIVADFGTKAAYASAVKFPSIDRNEDARRIPHFLLLEVLANARSMHYAGQRTYENKPQELITVMLANTRILLLLYFDKQTKLLTKYEYSTDMPGIGAAVIEYIFADHKQHPALAWFPSSQVIKVNGVTYRTVSVSQALADSGEAEAMMKLPPELEGFVTPAGTVKEIAKGVYFVYGVSGFQPMFIEFKDFVLAVEAPANHPSLEETPLETIGDTNSVTQEFIARIRQTIPNKPIKYVVITHSHSDHMGGLRAFNTENPTVLTSPGSKTFYEKFVPGLKVEAFDGKRIISDGQRTVELINVGKNPHTEENIIVYIPRENYIFQGDLFYFNGDASFPPKDRMTVMPFFANWLKKNKLAPARIYGFHGTLFATMEHVEKVLELSGGQR